MRCYHFGNYYMSSIQQGIQAAHAQMELFVKYKEIDLYEYSLSAGNNHPIHIYEAAEKADMLFDWAKYHKTMVCLNGGALQDLKNIGELMKDSENKYPWSTFYEDEYSLGGILTNVAIVLPEKIYDTATKIRIGELTLQDNDVYDSFDNFYIHLTDFEVKLIELLNSCQLSK